MGSHILVSGVRIYNHDIEGKKFRSICVLGPAFGRRQMVVVQCDCGTIKTTNMCTLLRGGITSCGCMRMGNQTHGMTHTIEYNSWRAMCERCMNQNSKYYKWYGAEGISVHPAWIGTGGFERWLSHIGPRTSADMTQDRIDSKGNYEPGNVRWATRKEQTNNRRQMKSMLMTYRGETKRLGDWAAILGIRENTLRERLRRGRTPEEIMNHPNNATLKQA